MTRGEMGGESLGRERGSDWARFFASWIRNPVKMGAIAPSSPNYCAAMADLASTEVDGPVLELGPGLGVVTRALIEKGVAPERVTSVEYDADFAKTLKQRFPRVDVVHGDGFDLDATLASRRDETFAAILFAIPILHFSQKQRQALFSSYFARLRPGGNLTQLSYLLTAPVKPIPGLFSVSSSPVIWDNVPPARVWVYAQDPVAGTGTSRTGTA